MKKFIAHFIVFFTSFFLLQSCNSTSTQDYKKGYQDGYADGLKSNAPTNTIVENPNRPTNNQDPNLNPNVERNKEVSSNGIPQKAVTVLNYIKKNNAAPDGFVGGRHFGNFEHLLPERDAAGNRIEYQEWDVNAKEQSKSRGIQRLVTGSDGRAWYSNNHYQSFVEMK